jgi:NADH dehydrogenase FAD-containing subunit
MLDTKKHIVIVGGGIAGAQLARDLSKDIDTTKHSLTLVTARPFNIFLPASIRMTTTADGRLEETVLVPYDNLFHGGNGLLKIGRVTAVEANGGSQSGAVLLANGDRILYDVLVLAPGYTWAGPLAFPDSEEDVLAHILSWREKFAAAKSVAMLGGGAAGFG